MYKSNGQIIAKRTTSLRREMVRRGKLYFALSFIYVIVVTAGHAQTTDDRLTFLTSGTSKGWYLYATTPESEGATCQTNHVISLDNTYTFFANGTFEFDHGTVTEDAGCEAKDCCSDFVNAVGTWEFTNNNTGLRVTLLHEKGKTEISKLVMYDAYIVLFDKNILRIAQTDPKTKTKYSLEFRNR